MRHTLDDDTTAQSTPETERVRYVGTRLRSRARVTIYPDERILRPTRSLEVVSHSPSGFEWGYGGSGPAQLALAILLDYTDDATVARAHYQQFKRDVVSELACTGPDGTWTLTAATIEATLDDAP